MATVLSAHHCYIPLLNSSGMANPHREGVKIAVCSKSVDYDHFLIKNTFSPRWATFGHSNPLSKMPDPPNGGLDHPPLGWGQTTTEQWDG